MIEKAVIPAAGFGTRFLPASKSQPKEMLPIVDTPTIQYVVEEAAAAGITDILMVIGKSKRAIEEHFDRSPVLEAELAAKGKTRELEALRRISDLADIHFVWQKELRGLGDAIRCARHHIGREPFAVLLGDTLLDAAPAATRQLIRIFEEYHEGAVALETVPRERVDRYGIVSGHDIDDGLLRIEDFIEKPSVEEAPSTLAIAGRYVFPADIFDCIDRTPPGRNGEIQITDAMRLLLARRPMYGLLVDGKRYDIGNKLDFLKTNVEYGLKREDIGADFRQWLKGLAKDL